MNKESINKLKQSMIETYRKFGDDKAILIKGKKSLDNNGFSFLNTENNDFSFYDRSSAKEFKRYFRMALMESESYIQRIIDNDYFEKLKWESIVTVFDGISLNKLYNKKGITFIDFGLDL